MPKGRKVKLKYPKISYCGINFGNNKWIRHMCSCLICKTEHAKQKERILNNWDKLCECGCNRKTSYGNRFYDFIVWVIVTSES